MGFAGAFEGWGRLRASFAKAFSQLLASFLSLLAVATSNKASFQPVASVRRPAGCHCVFRRLRQLHFTITTVITHHSIRYINNCTHNTNNWLFHQLPISGTFIASTTPSVIISHHQSLSVSSIIIVSFFHINTFITSISHFHRSFHRII